MTQLSARVRTQIQVVLTLNSGSGNLYSSACPKLIPDHSPHRVSTFSFSLHPFTPVSSLQGLRPEAWVSSLTSPFLSYPSYRESQLIMPSQYIQHPFISIALSKPSVFQSLFYSSLDVDLSTSSLIATPVSSDHTGHSDPATEVTLFHKIILGLRILLSTSPSLGLLCSSIRSELAQLLIHILAHRKGVREEVLGCHLLCNTWYGNLCTSFPFTFCQ